MESEEMPPTRDIIVPDQIIVKDPDAVSAEQAVPVEHVLLVPEVVSPLSIRADREVKPVNCAKAGIPFYLLADRFTEPMTVTLMSEPGTADTGRGTASPPGRAAARCRFLSRSGSPSTPRRCRRSGIGRPERLLDRDLLVDQA